MKQLGIIILCLSLIGCSNVASTRPDKSTATPTLVVFTSSPIASPTFTPRPTRTPTPIPWQSYKFTYSIKIGGVGKLWIPVPKEWDGVGMTNVSIDDISPKPDEIYQDNQENTIAFWNVNYANVKDYSVTFSIKLAPIKYIIDPDKIGEYDKSSAEYQRYTKSSTRIESDDEKIIQLAKQIVGNETNPFKQAELIHRWVSTNIKGNGFNGETALSTLNARYASCGGHSFLFIALLRSLGIPSRDVSGLHTVYEGYFSNGSFKEHTLYTHVWTEFYLPNYGWIQSDTSAGLQNFAEINEPRIILSRGEDIELGHDYPLQTVPWFHIPNSNKVGNADPKTQTIGKDLLLIVEKLP